jgi:hypothetical protein
MLCALHLDLNHARVRVSADDGSLVCGRRNKRLLLLNADGIPEFLNPSVRPLDFPEVLRALGWNDNPVFAFRVLRAQFTHLGAAKTKNNAKFLFFHLETFRPIGSQSKRFLEVMETG